MDRFVRTLKQDLNAVERAVTEAWSNGPVEGQINRLETLKRQMYGSAGVVVLRARLLPEQILGHRSKALSKRLAALLTPMPPPESKHIGWRPARNVAKSRKGDRVAALTDGLRMRTSS